MYNEVLDELVVVKRSGQRVMFNGTKIAIAIKSAFDDIYQTYDENNVNKVYNDVLSPLQADPGYILKYNTKNWRLRDYEIFQWDRFPEILIFDFLVSNHSKYLNYYHHYFLMIFHTRKISIENTNPRP